MILSIIIFAIVIFVLLYIFLLKKMKTNTVEEQSSVSTTLYNLVAALGLIATGIWVISTFNILEQRDLAENQLKELKTKLRNIESSKIEISTEIVPYQGISEKDEVKGLIVKVKLTNVGNSPISFDLSNTPLKIYEVAAKNTQIGYNNLYEPEIYTELGGIGGGSKNKAMHKFVSLISSERTLSYFAVLPKNKMYYIVFKTEAGDLSDDTEEQKVCDSKEKCKWFTSKYLYIQ